MLWKNRGTLFLLLPAGVSEALRFWWNLDWFSKLKWYLHWSPEDELHLTFMVFNITEGRLLHVSLFYFLFHFTHSVGRVRFSCSSFSFTFRFYYSCCLFIGYSVKVISYFKDWFFGLLCFRPLFGPQWKEVLFYGELHEKFMDYMYPDRPRYWQCRRIPSWTLKSTRNSRNDEILNFLIITKKNSVFKS